MALAAAAGLGASSGYGRRSPGPPTGLPEEPRVLDGHPVRTARVRNPNGGNRGSGGGAQRARDREAREAARRAAFYAGLDGRQSEPSDG